KILTLILKFTWNSFIYTLWKERTRRLFHGRKSNEEAILRSIIEVFKLRLLGRNINSSSNVNKIVMYKMGFEVGYINMMHGLT
ncbi:hypothetical protein ERO13_A05G031632v2, partial [Gossypium hirsutum]